MNSVKFETYSLPPRVVVRGTADEEVSRKLRELGVTVSNADGFDRTSLNDDLEVVESKQPTMCILNHEVPERLQSKAKWKQDQFRYGKRK